MRHCSLICKSMWMRPPAIRDDLTRWFYSKDLRLLMMSRFAIGKRRLDLWASEQSDSPLNTDMNMRLEFAAPLDLFRKLPPKEDTSTQISGTLDTEWTTHLGRVLGIEPDSAEYQLALGRHFFSARAT